MFIMDFPKTPVLGQRYTNFIGVTYRWDGVAWVVGKDDHSGNFTEIGDVIDQIRVLLQDTDNTGSGGYRYSTASIIANINMGMIEMYRLRPDVFLANGYTIQQFSIGEPDEALAIELQYMPPLVYYAVGMCQLRDDEENQDKRATALLARFGSMLISLP